MKPREIAWFIGAGVTGLALAPQLPRSIFLGVLYSFEPGHPARTQAGRGVP
jgi:hypothetical protein